MIDAVIWITKTIKLLNKNVGQIISKSVNSILNDIKYINIGQSDIKIYYAFKSFFLLGYQPRYTYKEILNILKTEDVNKETILMAAKIIGAKLGLDELIVDGLVLTKYTQHEINNLNMNTEQLGRLYYDFLL